MHCSNNCSLSHPAAAAAVPPAPPTPPPPPRPPAPATTTHRRQHSSKWRQTNRTTKITATTRAAQVPRRMTYSTISRCGRTIYESVAQHWSAASSSQLVTRHMPPATPATPPTKYYLATAKYLTYYFISHYFFFFDATPPYKRLRILYKLVVSCAVCACLFLYSQ